ncbi:MAG: dihydrofolate reductase family protein [Actinomycetota bacterium]
MTLTRVYPAGGPVHDVDAFYTVPRPEWLRISMIASIDGSAIGADGTSSTLTRGADRTVLGAIRRSSDVVLIGASSLRREGYLLPRSVPLAVVTASGDLTGHSIPAGLEAGRVFVLCPASVAESVNLPGASVIGIDSSGPLSGRSIVDALHHLGFRSVACEGGPTLATHLLADAMVDELCMSTSPVIGGPSAPALPGAPQLSFALSQLLVDDVGVSYARWIPVRPATD